MFLGYNQYWPGEFMVLWFNVHEHPKAKQAVFLILKRLRRRGHGLKFHMTDWEKPGIKPETPGLQGIGLYPTPTPRQLLKYFIIFLFCGRVSWLYQYWPGGFMVLWFYMYVQEHRKAQPAVVLVLKRLRRRGNGLSLIRQTGRSRELNLPPLVYKT